MIGMIVGKQRQKIVSKKSGSTIRGKWATFLALGVVGIGILVLFIATPTINWFRQNLHTIITVVLVLAALATAGILVWINRRKLVPKGIGVGEYLHEYTREPRNMKDGTLASEVWQKIVDFRCKRHYEKERDFQHELYRWLENEYPNRVEWEHKKGMSRADISIGRIAIEIKGPTGNSQLREAIRQIGTYGNDYDLIIFVLFKPQWGELYFDTFTRALSRFSHVGVITNSG
jgi:hypothetical protein